MGIKSQYSLCKALWKEFFQWTFLMHWYFHFCNRNLRFGALWKFMHYPTLWLWPWAVHKPSKYPQFTLLMLRGSWLILLSIDMYIQTALKMFFHCLQNELNAFCKQHDDTWKTPKINVFWKLSKNIRHAKFTNLTMAPLQQSDQESQKFTKHVQRKYMYTMTSL